jgi:hypothetical protein
MIKPEPWQQTKKSDSTETTNALCTINPQTAKYWVGRRHTKNGTPRNTSIPSVIMHECKSHKQIGNDLSLFPSSIVPEKLLDYKKQWAKCLKATNIKNFRWHDMASKLARDGKTLTEIAENLGLNL